MTLKILQMAMLAEFAVREASFTDTRGRFQLASVEQMQAICYCIRNRVRSGWNSSDWIANLEHAGEHAAHEREPHALDPDSRNLQILLMDIESIFYGNPVRSDHNLESSLKTAKYWCFLNRPMRPWFTQRIVQDSGNHPNRASLGTMLFYD